MVLIVGIAIVLAVAAAIAAAVMVSYAECHERPDGVALEPHPGLVLFSCSVEIGIILLGQIGDRLMRVDVTWGGGMLPREALIVLQLLEPDCCISVVCR
jgi:hypothetical protein